MNETITNVGFLTTESCYTDADSKTYLGKYKGIVYDSEGGVGVEYATFEKGNVRKENLRVIEVPCKVPVASAPVLSAPMVPTHPVCYQTYNGMYLGQFLREVPGLLPNGQYTPVLQHEMGVLVGNEWKQPGWVRQVQCMTRGGRKKTRRMKKLKRKHTRKH